MRLKLLGGPAEEFPYTIIANEPPPPKNFYVSMIRDSRPALLAGPYATHQAALDKVEEARRRATLADPACDFDAFGTAGSDREFKTAFGVI